MSSAAYASFWLAGSWGDGDSLAPTVSVSAPSAPRISRVTGKDTTSFSFTVDEDYQAYQIRVVPDASSPVSAGTLIESGSGGSANIAHNVDVTDDELVNAGLGEATFVVKVFVQDIAGNWST